MTNTQEYILSVFDKRLWLATGAGLLSIPVTVSLMLESSANELSITPILLTSLVIGFLYADRPTSVRRAGAQVGLIGGLPTMYQTNNTFELLSSSPEFALITAGFILVSITLSLTFSIIGSVFFAMVGRGIRQAIKENPQSPETS